MLLWLADAPLVLASGSVIRHTILRDAGLPVEVQPADIDERLIEQRNTDRDAGELARLLAGEKARTVAARFPRRLVLGADQTLTLDERHFSKPADRSGARRQLQALRGRTHELHSALALVRGSSILLEHCEVARLTMRAFSDQFLDAYLDSVGAEVTASVGGYQLERVGIQLFERIEGDHFTILGLPLLALLQYLRQAGWLAG
jgi:septum formation protein